MKLFEDKSIEYQNSLSSKERLANGIYYTPADLREFMFEELSMDPPEYILEPTCGSGEFVLDCEKRFPKSTVIGVEIDPRASAIAREMTTSDIITCDFMEWKSDIKFDLIIGNPPYFTRPTGFKHNPDVVTCRSNICVEVLHKCMTQHLSDKGIIAFVLPSSILNSKFYKPINDLIISTMDIVSVKSVDKHKFMGTGVNVFVFVLRKNSTVFSSEYVYVSPLGRKIINEHSTKMDALVNNRQVVGNLDVDISFGVTAASVKPHFTDSAQSFPLICSANITKKSSSYQLVADTYPKKRFTGRAILIPRGYGHGRYKFEYMEFTGEFIIENHVIAITGSSQDLDTIATSFADTRTQEFLDMLCQVDISKEYVKEIPIFTD
jgi:predicted RNA methylase